MKKKIIPFCIVLFLIIGGIYLCFKPEKTPVDNLTVEKQKAMIDTLYIYGNHFNLGGSIKLENIDTIKSVKLVLFGKKELEYDLKTKLEQDSITFQITDKKNTGIKLENIEKNNYLMFLKTVDDKQKIKYYPLQNHTEYPKTEYYTLRKENTVNSVTIETEKQYDTLALNVEKAKDSENIYDIVIDAGHGGLDSGACKNGKCETDYTLKLAKKLKEQLEKQGFKVKLTRDTDTLKQNELLDTYGENGRVAIPHNVKAKYLFSFHLNSGASTMRGTEIYTTNHIDYTLARNIAKNIVSYTGTSYSNNPSFKMENGVYTRTFQTYEINQMEQDAKKDGYTPYPVTTDTTYYYIIRETGGILTGAYTDGREEDKNPYYNTNVGIESYIMEIGYITNNTDINNIEKKMDKYVEGIKEAICEHLCES